ncbi:MAG TPA: hypothetical protein VHK67_05190 [Rhabdochlamydiaceae bacterium]|nr:hypothetical protein [Rhabdochlamydiaceae bacterium]
MQKLVRIGATFRTLLKYCLCLSFFLLTSVGYTENKKTHNIKEFQDYFKNVLLVVYYANPHFETIDFLKELYSPVFKNIVFYGDRTQHVDSGEADHEYEDGYYGRYRIVYTRNGYYLSRWIKDVMINYPGYAGYLFMQDDVLLQFWNFLNLDKNKIWFGVNGLGRPTIHGYGMVINRINDPQYTNWFNTECGMPRMKEVFGHLLELGLDEERAMLSANFQENGAAWYLVDSFYIPGRFAGKVLRLCDLFDKVFCEISIPTMLGAMDYLQNWEELDHWWACFDSGNKLKQAHDPKYYWMHPLKFSYKENREFARRVFNENFYNALENN